ncbi:MAG: hypothetical protein IKZ21_04300 [Clostridia bacterium]|nr:hypothetical protein [Clostridia bacterium]
MIRTVLGDISCGQLGRTLVHEHICCYSEPLFQMSGSHYLDKEALISASVRYLRELKSSHHLNTFMDCTPPNIGRDLELLKEVSYASEVNIIGSTGFYYTQEPILYNTDAATIARCMEQDIASHPIGIIKCAVEDPEISDFSKKLLQATAMAHLDSGLPIVMHTNARNRNGLPALELLLEAGVDPRAVTVGHLSDTDDLDYVSRIASYGCFIGFDRLYDNPTEEYLSRTAQKIKTLAGSGFADRILLSHDALFFNGFESQPVIHEKPRFAFCFDHILPRLPDAYAEQMLCQNPLCMLRCGK